MAGQIVGCGKAAQDVFRLTESYDCEPGSTTNTTVVMAFDMCFGSQLQIPFIRSPMCSRRDVVIWIAHFSQHLKDLNSIALVCSVRKFAALYSMMCAVKGNTNLHPSTCRQEIQVPNDNSILRHSHVSRNNMERRHCVSTF
jgi:hypothetical protein